MKQRKKIWLNILNLYRIIKNLFTIKLQSKVGLYSWLTRAAHREGNAGEFRPYVLTEPYVSLPTHTALTLWFYFACNAITDQ
jgi:hypothetical protein